MGISGSSGFALRIFCSSLRLLTFDSTESLLEFDELEALIKLSSEDDNHLWFFFRSFQIFLLSFSASPVLAQWCFAYLLYFSSPDYFDKDNRNFGTVRMPSLIRFCSVVHSTWSFTFLRINLAVARIKQATLRSRWEKASMNENEFFQRSGFHSNTLFM